MKLISDFYNNLSIKFRIIFGFSLLTAILVLVMSYISYVFVKDIYLTQLSDQVKVSSRIIAYQIERKYLDLLNLGFPVKSSENYFRKVLSSHLDPVSQTEAFLFDKNFNIIVHSKTDVITGKQDPRLMLNKKEIMDLKDFSSAASLPFKGDDGNWYLWGFCRLNDSFFIAIRESAAKLERVEQFSVVFWLIGLTGMTGTILLGWIIARTISRPVDVLVKFSHKIGSGELNEPLNKKMYGELNILANAMDNMRSDLARSQKDKENMLAQIAHEIRNPLGGIELLASLVKEDLLKLGKDTSYVDKILEELNGLKALITSFLYFSRPISAHPCWTETTGLFNDIENIFKTKLTEKNISLKVEDKIGRIFFDPAHLKNIIVNLVANALESLCNYGEIIIKAAVCDGQWVISVIDNGGGISNENIPMIFETFFSTKANGTGLGLAISKKMCEENHALLTAENNKTKGATFTIIKKIYEN